MEHRVRAAGIFIQEGKILLVLHRHPENGSEWWIPPGGGVIQEDSSIFDAARREIFEETGLSARVTRIGYIREFRENATNTYHLEFFIPVDSFSGQITIENIPHDALDYGIVKEVRWLDRFELDNLVVYPGWIKDDWFWQDAEMGFPETRYMGVQDDTATTNDSI
ncbi:MAG: NUDIX domain-containing protein [Chloroflexota bacterium]|nr:NUDIX domain-containing protein [Chloroflexota bacterium]